MCSTGTGIGSSKTGTIEEPMSDLPSAVLSVSAYTLRFRTTANCFVIQR